LHPVDFGAARGEGPLPFYFVEKLTFFAQWDRITGTYSRRSILFQILFGEWPVGIMVFQDRWAIFAW
jgi:hypothetical protein